MADQRELHGKEDERRDERREETGSGGGGIQFAILWRSPAAKKRWRVLKVVLLRMEVSLRQFSRNRPQKVMAMRIFRNRTVTRGEKLKPSPMI